MVAREPARSGGVDRIRFTQYGFVARDVEPDWGLQPTGWRIRVHGDAPFDLRCPPAAASERLRRLRDLGFDYAVLVVRSATEANLAAARALLR